MRGDDKAAQLLDPAFYLLQRKIQGVDQKLFLEPEDVPLDVHNRLIPERPPGHSSRREDDGRPPHPMGRWKSPSGKSARRWISSRVCTSMPGRTFNPGLLPQLHDHPDVFGGVVVGDRDQVQPLHSGPARRSFAGRDPSWRKEKGKCGCEGPRDIALTSRLEAGRNPPGNRSGPSSRPRIPRFPPVACEWRSPGPCPCPTTEEI